MCGSPAPGRAVRSGTDEEVTRGLGKEGWARPACGRGNLQRCMAQSLSIVSCRCRMTEHSSGLARGGREISIAAIGDACKT